MDRYLIIGGDGLIGSYLGRYFSLKNKFVMSTSRKNADTKGIYFDMTVPRFDVLAKFTHVFLCAGITSIAECERSPHESYKINVDAVVEIAKFISKNQSRIYYISSSTVFDGSATWPDENVPTCPITEYGRQKVEVENQLCELSHTSIIRITKLITLRHPLFHNFYMKLHKKQVVEAYKDLNLNPISAQYLCDSILNLVNLDKDGIFHLSGANDITYCDLIKEMAQLMDRDKRLINCITSDLITFKPPLNAGLGMRRTQRELGIKPELPHEAVLKMLTEKME